MEPLGLGALIINVALLIAVLGFMWKLSRDVQSTENRTGDRLDAFRAEVQKDQKDVHDKIDAFRAEVQKDLREFRTEVREDMRKLSGRMDVLAQQVSTVGERVARIAGRLQMPGIVIVPKPAEETQRTTHPRTAEIGRERTELAEADA